MPKHIIDTGAQSFANDVEVLGALTAPNQIADSENSVLTKKISEDLTLPSANNVEVVSYFNDFLGPHIFTGRTIHGVGGSITFGQVSTQPLSFDTAGILGIRAGASATVPSAAQSISYPNHSNQGSQVFLAANYVDRKYFSRFHLYGSLTRAYYHFLISTVAPNNSSETVYTNNPNTWRHVGIVGCTAGTPIRENNTPYVVGSIITLEDSIYRWRCTVAGTSDSSEPTFDKVINSTTVDGSVSWKLETFNTNGFWAVLNIGNHLPAVDGNTVELIVTDIPIERLKPYKVIYDFYTTELGVKRVKIFIKAGNDEMVEAADLLGNNLSTLESPYYAVQREEVGTNVIGANNSVIPWLEIDYFGFTTRLSR